MDRIETDSTTHVLAEIVDDTPDEDGNRQCKTLCGRTIWGRTGGCTPEMIVCRNCRRSLRAAGWKL